MLVVNRIGPAKIRKVVLRSDSVEVYLVSGEEISYRRIKACGSIPQKVVYKVGSK